MTVGVLFSLRKIGFWASRLPNNFPKGATLCSIKESFDTRTPAGKLQMTMLAAIAEFERSMIKERQAEGIAIAKRKGVYFASLIQYQVCSEAI